MDRRHFLRLAAALAALPLPSTRAARRLRVVVAGAGIVGAAIAFHLSRAGARVTVIDREGPATHASRGSFAWINATWAKQPRSYHRFNQRALADWQDLQSAVRIPVKWGGSLEWFGTAARQATLVKQIEEQVRWGEPARMLDAAGAARLEPALRFPRDTAVAYSPNDGAVDPVLATRQLLAAAQESGALLRYPCTLEDVDLEDSRLVAVRTSAGRIAADRLVLATGAEADLGQRVAGLAIPQRSTPGIIAVTERLPRLLNRVVAAPGVHLHQRLDGRMVIGEQAGPPATHGERLQGRPNDFPDPALSQQHAKRLLDAASELVPKLRSARIAEAFIGWRPLPLDGHPVLGVNPERPHIYLAIMHSGITLAPLVGALAAAEIVHGDVDDALHAYRPTRNFRQVFRY